MNCIAANSYHCLIKQHEIHIVPQGIEPQRLQEYGVGIFIAANTKSALKKAIKKNYISINGQNASTADFIRGGETIELYIPKESTQKKQLIFPIDVLFEDEYLAVIRKPAGILVSGNGFMTIANALVQNLKPSNQVDATKPQPVHRLDYATTGALLVGKTSSSIRALNKLFENGQVEKTYYAINIGTLEESGTISAPIDDKKAITHFQVVDTAVSERFTQLNLLKLNLETGRRHQIRKHLSSIGNPILGDKDYGKEGLILKGKGMYLHARSLEFEHPFTSRNIIVKAPFPKRFSKIFDLKEK